MLKTLTYILSLFGLAFLLFSNHDLKIITAGVAVFLIGMVFMEDGFRLFSGGLLEKILQLSTSSLLKAISSGFFVTAIIQSSSLVSIIVISFLSAEIITLSGAIGIIFGSNIGTTATAWIVSSFGVKIHIAYYAMPMLIFGVIFRFNTNTTYKAFGNILVGLGFVFLGIGYMKEGFESIKSGLDLAAFAMDGYLGVFVYIGIGALATIIIQSSSATMALIITALVANQIVYVNALELAIGANIGTTVTAVLGSLASNLNGKRLAIAHLIFNIVTALIATVFLYQLAELVDFLAQKIGIASEDYGMKLALFHTLFNLIGVIVVAPFTSKLVKFLNTHFKEKRKDISRAKYLDNAVIKVPEAAIMAIQKEVQHLYDNAVEILFHALSLHKHTILGLDEEKMQVVVQEAIKKMDLNIEDIYDKNIKTLYGDIIHFATLAQENMTEDEKDKIYLLKMASRDIVESVKNIKELQKNINRYIHSKNEHIKNEYNFLRKEIAKTLDTIYLIEHSEDDFEALAKIKLLEESLQNLDVIRNGRIDALIRTDGINAKMATSLINDSSFAYDISKNLIKVAKILWIQDRDIQKLGGTE